MEYDFFNENNKPNDEKNDIQRIPASPQDDKKAFGKLAKIGRICLAGVLAVIIFLGGMLTTWMMLDPEIRTLITVKKRIQNEYYKEITDEDFYKAIFGGINDTLLDAYSGYMTPEEFAKVLSEMGGNRIGVGLTFASQQTEPLRITRVCGNSPAEDAGIVAGEKIIACGNNETEMKPCETFEDFTSFLANYGEKEDFYLTLTSSSGERTVKLHKAAYVENLVFYRTSTSAYAFTGAQADILTEKGLPLNCLDEDTAYIRLVEFTGNAANEFALAMGQFRRDGKKHLILDLRENGGGYLDIMQSIASYFCKNTTEKRPIVAVADFGNKKTVYRATGNYYDEYFAQDSRICVLADRYSASASECLIGCMLDYGAIAYGDICLAERNGVAKTYGKGIMQETSYVNILKQDAITLTTAEIRWPVSNNSIHGRGVLPEDGALTVAENTDFEMETINAVNTLLSKAGMR